MNIKSLELFRRKLRQLEREVEEQVKMGKSCCGISLAQCHVLMELGLLKKTTITELSDILKLDKSTLSRTIEAMVKMGIVERTIATKDRRFMEVMLSESGHVFYDTLNRTCNEFYHRVFSLISQNRHDQVIESMNLFTDAVARVHEEGNLKSGNDGCNCAAPEHK